MSANLFPVVSRWADYKPEVQDLTAEAPESLAE